MTPAMFNKGRVNFSLRNLVCASALKLPRAIRINESELTMAHNNLIVSAEPEISCSADTATDMCGISTPSLWRGAGSSNAPACPNTGFTPRRQGGLKASFAARKKASSEAATMKFNTTLEEQTTSLWQAISCYKSDNADEHPNALKTLITLAAFAERNIQNRACDFLLNECGLSVNDEGFVINQNKRE